MWIFHPLGFASIVKSPGLGLLARGRFKGDLERLFPGCEVETTTDRDYRFRTRVTPRVVTQRLFEMVQKIDYPNFKDACPDDRHDVYMDVWSALYREQARRMPRRGRGKRRLGNKLTGRPEPKLRFSLLRGGDISVGDTITMPTGEKKTVKLYTGS